MSPGHARPALLVLAVLIATALILILRSDPTGAPPEGRSAAAGIPETAGQSVGDARTADEIDRDRIDRAAVPATRDKVQPRVGATSLWGKVVRDSDQTPVAGARVELRHADGDQFWNIDLEYGERIETVGTAVTDAKGTFAFPVERSRKFRLRVTATGFATTVVGGRTGGSEVVIRVAPASSLHLTVVDKTTGKPLPDTRVRITSRYGGITVAQATTIANGTAGFDELPAGRVFVVCRSPAHLEFSQELELLPGNIQEITLSLESGHSLRGRVLDKVTRSPIGGAEISDTWTFTRLVRTDVDGGFVLGGVQRDRTVLCYVRAVEYARACQAIARGAKGDVTFELVRGGSVAGRIVDDRSQPVPGAYVALGASYSPSTMIQGTDLVTAAVDKDGRFRASGLRPDLHYTLFVRSRGHGTRIYALEGPVPPGREHELGDVVLRPEGSVEGRVVDRAGNPLPESVVSITGGNADEDRRLEGRAAPPRVSQFTIRTVDAGVDGGFRFSALSGGKYTLSAKGRTLPEGVNEEIEVTDGGVHRDLRLRLDLGVEIRGELRVPPGHDRDLGATILAADDGQRLVRSRVAADGSFRFVGLKRTDHTLTLMHTTGLVGFCLRPHRKVPGGTENLVLELELGETIRGRVVDAKGRAGRAYVWISDPEKHSPFTASATTDKEGRFALTVLPGFRGTIQAQTERVGSKSRTTGRLTEVRAGQQGLVVELR